MTGGDIFKQDLAPCHFARKKWNNFRRARYQGCWLTWELIRYETHRKFVENFQNKANG